MVFALGTQGATKHPILPKGFSERWGSRGPKKSDNFTIAGGFFMAFCVYVLFIVFHQIHHFQWLEVFWIPSFVEQLKLGEIANLSK